MKDDDFSGIVRSGTSHSVSVSEHTGNAKTPKNVVTSNPDETLAKKIAFETKSDADLNLEQLAHEDDATHSAKPHHTADTLAKNVQNVSTDVIDTNHQKIDGNGNIEPNRQALPSDAKHGPNVQGVPVDTIAANAQNIPVDGVDDNHQKLDGNSQITSNKQALPSNANNGRNVQGVPIDTVAANVQGIPTDALEDNHQQLGKEALPNNQQRIDEEVVAPNLQALPSNADGSNRAALDSNAITDNAQALPHDTVANNTQPAPTLAASDNHQAVEEGGIAATNRQPLAAPPGLETNRQGVDTPASELNRQSAPEDLSTTDNRQALDNEHLEDHFEPLPSTTVALKNVDFPTSSPTPGSAKPAPAAVASRNAKAKPAVAATAAQRQAALAAAQQAQHEKFLEAFHGRLAGIKHDVDQINDRLDVFEHKK